MESSAKINVWMRETKTPRNMDRGDRNRSKNEGAARVIARSIWSAIMFPNSRMDRERIRARWLMISMGNIKGAEPQDRAEKMFEILNPWALIPTVMGGKEDDQGAGHGGVQIVRGGQKARDQAQKVGKEDEEPQGPDEGEKLPPLVADDVIAETSLSSR